jgi:uncharacterized protein HemX
MSGAAATALTVAAAAAVVGTGYSIYNGEQQRKAQGEANKQAERAAQDAKANAEKTQKMQEQEINRANAKRPDTNAMLAANEQSAKGGASGTMLTGPQGVDPNSLALSKNTLLGG